jgi:hypothetical protein
MSADKAGRAILQFLPSYFAILPSYFAMLQPKSPDTQRPGHLRSRVSRIDYEKALI